jgi:hypothetical protein
MIEAAAPRTIKTRLWGILSAIQLKTTTAIAESVNPTIQKIKARACGFRHRPRSRMAILFDKRGGGPYCLQGSLRAPRTKARKPQTEKLRTIFCKLRTICP